MIETQDELEQAVENHDVQRLVTTTATTNQGNVFVEFERSDGESLQVLVSREEFEILYHGVKNTYENLQGEEDE